METLAKICTTLNCYISDNVEMISVTEKGGK
ncbi:hypothetical protein [Acetobacterium paludosum]|nr:hypothetical protein [Acetobacterium paludosum]